METRAPLLGEPLPVELMNTIWADRDGVHDALSEATGTEAWLRAITPRVGLPTASDLDIRAAADIDHLRLRLLTLRDALRRLAAEATGDPRSAAASATRELGCRRRRGQSGRRRGATLVGPGLDARRNTLTTHPHQRPGGRRHGLGHRRGCDPLVQPGRPTTTPRLPRPRMRPLLPQGPPPPRMVLPGLRQPGPRRPPLPAPPQLNGLTVPTPPCGGRCRDATAGSWPGSRSAATRPGAGPAASRRPGPATPGSGHDNRE